MRGVSLFRCGAIAAIIGTPFGFADSAKAALWHDRIVARALRRCSAVVPFRLGIEVRSEAEVDSLLRLNVDELSDQLRRFEGRVEVGLKTRVALPTGDEPLCLPFGINRVRALASRAVDRHERLSRGPRGTTFEGCYLISRRAVNGFWRALNDIRRAVPEVPLLGSGPWAPYSFCDAPLRRSAEQTRVALESR
jgi:hypothetical protein